MQPAHPQVQRRMARQRALGAENTMSLLLLLGLVAAAAAESLIDQRNDDLIDWLPNSPENLDFRQYSGYVAVDQSVGGHFFYYFVEAAVDDPPSRPLVLYLFCQDRLGSPLAAAFQQVGPFRVDTDGQSLVPNPNSWNRDYNVLFVEAPLGVGFTYITVSILDVTDNGTVPQLLAFIDGWMARFPEYGTSDLYIAGQGDVGVLAPPLALAILDQNSKATQPPINLKGLIMGAPNLDRILNKLTEAEYLWQVGVISTNLARQCKRACAHEAAAHGTENLTMGSFIPSECLSLFEEVQQAYVYLDPSSLYAPTCPDLGSSWVDGANSFNELYTCDDQYTAGYLSIPFVQKALHVKHGNGGPQIWKPSPGVGSWVRNMMSTLGMLRDVLNRGVRVLVYSGVFDYELPHSITQGMLSELNMTAQTGWRAWFGKSPIELAGFTTSFKDGLTYATVRNSGKKLSKDQPENVYAMIQSFTKNEPLPRSQYFPDA